MSHPTTTSSSTSSTPTARSSTSRAEAAAHEPWFNQTLTQIDDAVVRLGIIEGDFHWHKHDDQDEFFLVLEGRLLIDIEDARDRDPRPQPGLQRRQGRRPPHARPEGRTVILMVERAGVVPTGD